MSASLSRVRGVVAKSPAWAGVAVELRTVMLPTAGTKDPALLFSGGKDSFVLLALAIKAFQIPGRTLQLPFTLLHVYTGHNYLEVIVFRDETVARTGVYLVVGHVEDSIKKGTVVLRRDGLRTHRHPHGRLSIRNGDGKTEKSRVSHF
nr:phosphoadenosine phosphosulfate reductase family protein [uncultured Cardiobacterium sp.]